MPCIVNLKTSDHYILSDILFAIISEG